VEVVKSNPKAWLLIEEEIVSSMKNGGAKESAKLAIQLYKKKRTSFAEMKYGIMRLIKGGYSTFSDYEELLDLYEKKEYYTINKDEYGDYYESEILHTKT
tara:strand:- start:1112 stop:1411 length:300 start_codon:yes stop_codon:yes gene_type:complete